MEYKANCNITVYAKRENKNILLNIYSDDKILVSCEMKNIETYKDFIKYLKIKLDKNNSYNFKFLSIFESRKFNVDKKSCYNKIGDGYFAKIYESTMLFKAIENDKLEVEYYLNDSNLSYKLFLKFDSADYVEYNDNVNLRTFHYYFTKDNKKSKVETIISSQIYKDKQSLELNLKIDDVCKNKTYITFNDTEDDTTNKYLQTLYRNNSLFVGQCDESDIYSHFPININKIMETGIDEIFDGQEHTVYSSYDYVEYEYKSCDDKNDTYILTINDNFESITIFDRKENEKNISY